MARVIRAPIKILFWSPIHRPQDFVRATPHPDRDELATILAKGNVCDAYMGWAECRICGERLGTRDFGGCGFLWPEKAEHYLLAHSVWTPGCDALLAAVRRRSP